MIKPLSINDHEHHLFHQRRGVWVPAFAGTTRWGCGRTPAWKSTAW